MLACGIHRHHPLTLNLRRQTNLYCQPFLLPQYAIDIHNASSTAQLLTILSKLLAAPAFTLTVADLYRPILYDLCARWLEDQQGTEEQLVALCLLIKVHEELFPCVFPPLSLISPTKYGPRILHRLLLKPTFKEGLLTFITAEPSPLSIDTSRLHRLLLAGPLPSSTSKSRVTSSSNLATDTFIPSRLDASSRQRCTPPCYTLLCSPQWDG